MWPIAVVVGGVPVNLDAVLADVTIRQGRASAYEQAQASSAQLVLLDVTRAQSAAFTVGVPLVIDTDAGRRFTGHITDAELIDNDLTVVAVGMLARYSRLELPVGWTAPAEPWSARVERVIQLGGLMRSVVPYEASNWSPSGTTTVGGSPGPPPYTFWNLPANTPIWNYVGTRSTFAMRKGQRYRISTPQLGGGAFDMLVGFADGDPSLSVSIPAAAVASWQPWHWDFVAGVDAPAVRIIFYNLSVLPEASYIAIQPLTVEMLPGYSVVKDSDFDPVLAAVDGTDTSVVKMVEKLNELADDVGALVCDMPNGQLLVQALGGRVSAGAVPIDPADVLYAPPWVQVDDVANVVTVKYQGSSVTVRDAGSVGVFDERRTEIETTIVAASDANLRAVERLSRAAYPRWIMPSCPLLRGYTFQLGGMAHVTELPPGSPVDSWSAVVEGWSDTITGDDWTMDVALSDALQSGLVLPWNEVPAGVVWNAVPLETDWNDATTVDAVTP